MSYILIHMRDGSQREFKDTPRSGGSYEKKVSYEGNFVIVTDEWYKQTVFPMDLVREVEITPSSSW
jgi:hypothetical protein